MGVDEVGFGSLAGPVAVGGVVARADWQDPRVRDSKQLDGAVRARLVREVLLPPTVAFSLVLSHDNLAIDRMGVGRARDDLVRQVVDACRAKFPSALVVMDGNQAPPGVKNLVCIPKADQLVKAVSAASILAKEDRDECMRLLHEEWPAYNFENNVGYGTEAHLSALNRFGPCPIHRFSYKIVREVVERLGMKPPSTTGGSQTSRTPGKISGWRQPPKGMRVSTSSSKR